MRGGVFLDAYEKLYHNDEINKILDNINNLLPTNFAGCHGRYHAMFVVDTIEHILKSLSYGTRTVELGKIAALFHDIGNIAGRWHHAQKSAALAVVFLDGSEQFLPEEKAIITQAIEDHSNGHKISSAVGAALLIADKLDITQKRVMPKENIDDFHKNLREIEDVIISVADKVMTVNYITTAAFCKNILLGEYKGFNLSKKAAKYLGCTCEFQFNSKEA